MDSMTANSLMNTLERNTKSHISLRDYLAAHAPNEPQSWFKPVMRPSPSPPPRMPSDELPSSVRMTAREWLSDPHWDVWVEHPELKPWCEAWGEYYADANAWEREQAEQRLRQWPYAWADAMLAEREKSRG
jgi:hypothetical protein